MRKLLSLAFLTALFTVGCSHRDLTPVKGPDGQEWVAISCRDNASNCWQTAGEFCPNGYEIGDEVQSTSRGFLIFGRHARNEMLIRCKA
jgi:hypothetical protein